MANEHNYKSIIALTIFIGILLLIIFVNPNVFHKGYFNNTIQDIQYTTLDLSTNAKISEYIESRIKWISDSALGLKRQNKISEEQADKINEEGIEAQRELDNYKSNKNENNLYMALFKTQEVILYKKAYPFFNCEDEVYNLSKRYYWLFYYMSDIDRKKVLDLHETRKYLDNTLSYSTQYMEDYNRTIMLARDAENIESRYNFYKINCDQFNEYLKKDYQRQRYWFLAKLLAVIFIFILGFIFGNILTKKKIKKFERKSNWIMKGIKKAFSPEKVEDETIKTILKTSSVTTALVAFLGIALTISGFNTWFVVILILLSVLSLLASILTGIIGLNNGQDSFKKSCYRLFIFGLALFIIFFLYIIFFGGIATFFKGMAEAAKTYLNNQTIK